MAFDCGLGYKGANIYEVSLYNPKSIDLGLCDHDACVRLLTLPV